MGLFTIITFFCVVIAPGAYSDVDYIDPTASGNDKGPQTPSSVTCPVGFSLENGLCVQRSCPSTHYWDGTVCRFRIGGNFSPTTCSNGQTLLDGLCYPIRSCDTISRPMLGTTVCQPQYQSPMPGCEIQPCLNKLPPVQLCTYQQSLPLQPLQNQQILSCVNQTNIFCQSTNANYQPPCQSQPTQQCINQACITQLTLLQPTPQTPPCPPQPPCPTQPPPPPIIRCPNGTDYINGECVKKFGVYCPFGYHFYNGRCVEIICRTGTVWTGNSCEKTPVVQTTLEIKHYIYNHVNQSIVPNVTIHMVNNVNVSSLGNRTILVSCNQTDSESNCEQDRPQQKCCTVVAPRTCKQINERWICYNRRYKRCGAMCQKGTVYLKAPRVRYQNQLLVMPPDVPMQDCSTNCNDRDTISCSGCHEFRPETCSPYCYDYHCAQRGCQFVEQREYCTSNRGQIGCLPADGCLEDFCTNDEEEIEYN